MGRQVWEHLQPSVTFHLKHGVLIINTVIWKSGIKAVSKHQCASYCYEGLEVLHFWSMHSGSIQVVPVICHQDKESFSAICVAPRHKICQCCFRWGCEKVFSLVAISLTVTVLCYNALSEILKVMWPVPTPKTSCIIYKK